MRHVLLENARPMPGCVVTVGTFDGVHVGHRDVVEYVVARARAVGTPAAVVTFSPHPRAVLRGQPVPLLTTIEERAALLSALGVDETVVIPFTPDVAALPAALFVEQVLVEKLGVGEVVIGYDHGFGRRREGNADLLRELAPRLGFRVDVIPAHVVEKHAVSSTLIRRLLVEAGDVAAAAPLLGRFYTLAGRVVAGDRRGRTIGFPTANLAVAPEKLVPARGVYAVWADTEGEGRWPAMMNIGTRPTFRGDEMRAEVHLLGFEGDLYEQTLRVEFIGRLRDEQRFEGIAALRGQLGRDAARCHELLGTTA